MRTEMQIDGANCPTCLSATLEFIAGMPGVNGATASSTGGCLAIEHDDLDPALLAAAIKSHLHGTAMYGAELMMVSVDPIVAEIRCTHTAAHGT